MGPSYTMLVSLVAASNENLKKVSSQQDLRSDLFQFQFV